MEQPSYRIEKYGRFWAVYASDGQLICVTVYKKGAEEVARILRSLARS